MLKSTDTKVMATLLVGLAFLLLIGGASIFTLQQFEQATEVRSRTHEVMQSVTRLHYELKTLKQADGAIFTRTTRLTWSPLKVKLPPYPPP